MVSYYQIKPFKDLWHRGELSGAVRRRGCLRIQVPIILEKAGREANLSTVLVRQSENGKNTIRFEKNKESWKKVYYVSGSRVMLSVETGCKSFTKSRRDSLRNKKRRWCTWGEWEKRREEKAGVKNFYLAHRDMGSIIDTNQKKMVSQKG